MNNNCINIKILKENKGLTIISLVITLIVMIIIFGITFVSGTVLLEQSKLTKIKTQLYLVKARAEVLAEQYQFDGDLKHLLSFSKLESQNQNPIAYNFGRENNIQYTSNNIIFTAKVTEQFRNDIIKIYKVPIVDYINDEETYGQYLFVKWGINECISNGIIKESDVKNKDFLNNSVINDKYGEKKYAIVVYDIKNGELESIAYSVGVRDKNNELKYTLDDIMTIDIEEE